MNKVIASSISKKFVMALAGLFLLTFLPVHLGINFLLLKPDPEPFNKAAEFMATFPVIKIVEIILMLAILIHIIYGIVLQIQNWLARPRRYSSGSKSKTSFFSKFMIWTGGTIFIFLVIHFLNFYFIKLGLVDGIPVEGEAEDFYSVAYQLFKKPVYNIIYWVCFAGLGLHLFHAFSSAFQTLGLNHRIWTPVVNFLAVVYAIIIPLGFMSIPLIIWLFK